MTFFNSQLKTDLYPARKKAKGIKGLSVPIVTVTHPVSTDRPDAVTTSTGGDTWIEAMPWRRPVRQKMSNMPEELEGIPLLLDNNSLTESNKLSNSDMLESNKSNAPKFDKKAYQRDLMRKRRQK